MTTATAPVVRTGRVTKLSNQSCVYCGSVLVPAAATEEHVIGRRFVPKGKLNGEWNLIAQCCTPCNNRKSKLEDDISAILLQPDGVGALAEEDPKLVDEAVRKGRAHHRTTGKPVRDSAAQISVPVRLGQHASATFGLTGPPPLHPERVDWLAWHHVTAFTYLSTFDPHTGLGHFNQGTFLSIDQALRSDWGNVVQREFAAATADWKVILGLRTADGYFKAMIRRHPIAHCLSWALEWNRNLRIIGIMGDRAAADAFAADLPQPEFTTLAESGGESLRYREEHRLAPDDDTLFEWSEETLMNQETTD
jgi:hypothetical protein